MTSHKYYWGRNTHKVDASFICCHFPVRCQVAAKRSTSSAPTLVVICVQKNTFVAVELAAN